jgi:hypothetical protein
MQNMRRAADIVPTPVVIVGRTVSEGIGLEKVGPFVARA